MKRVIFLLLGASAFFLLSCNSESNRTEETSLASSIQEPSYQEPHRPQYHFSPPAKWMNDPNGMVFYQGQYHLFYQHYPDSSVWGPMHWGHTVSRDMVNWENLPIALYPDSNGYIFSGSAVLDQNNSSGLGTQDNPPLVAIFTYHDPVGEKNGSQTFQTQGLAYSLDQGKTWKPYEDNPVLPNPGIRDFRDPKVFWHEESSRWVMVLATADRITLFASPDLKSWEKLSEFGADIGSHEGVWECPDLFPLKTTTDEVVWVMLVSVGSGGPAGGSGTQYFYGNFDGNTFQLNPSCRKALSTSENKAFWLDYGADNYAGVTWANIPEEDGRRLFIGWMSNWAYAIKVPTEVWRSAMTLPRTLSLEALEQGMRLKSQPVKELDLLQGEPSQILPQALEGTVDWSNKLPSGLSTWRLRMELDLGDSNDKDFSIHMSNEAGDTLTLGYIASEDKFYTDRRQAGKVDFSDAFPQVHKAPRDDSDQILRLDIWLDVSSLEVFADGGLTTMTETYFAEKPFTQLTWQSAEPIQLKEAKVFPLKSIWNEIRLK